jgi:hypothetical protein
LLAYDVSGITSQTLTQWSEKGQEQRYFKGANKIFQVSNYHPVGMMIFDSADIMKVPWEVVVKQFRVSLGNKSFNDLKGYAEEFFSFLNGDARLFPQSVQKEAFLAAARVAVAGILLRTKSREDADEAQRRADIDAAVAARRAELDGLPLNPCVDEEIVADVMTSWCDDLVKMIEEWRGFFGDMGNIYPTNLNNLAEMCIQDVFKRPEDHLGRTGIVFAGFGDHDIFPSMIEYSSSGMVAGKHVSSEVSKASIDHELPAWLSAFAQTAMSDTFSLGLSGRGIG